MNLEAIGVIHSPFLTVEGTPIQPRGAAGIEGTVEVASALAPGLKDLDGFERIWLIYWCDRAGYDEHGLVVTPYLDWDVSSSPSGNTRKCSENQRCGRPG